MTEARAVPTNEANGSTTDAGPTAEAPIDQVVEPGVEPDVEPGPNVAYHDFGEWHGKDLLDRDGATIGKLEDVYFDVETDQPQFATVKEGGLLVKRHLTFVPLNEVTIGPDNLSVTVSKAQVKSAPNIELHGDELSQDDESTLYHYYRLNYAPSDTPSGRRLARR